MELRLDLLKKLGKVTLAAFAAGLFLRPVHADPPTPVQQLLSTCQSFTRMSAEVVASPVEGSTRSYPLLVNAQATWFTADALWGNQPRFSWSSQTNALLQHHVPEAQPVPAKTIPVPIILDLWAACRNGFQGSSWTERSPHQDGYRHDFRLVWYKGTLPQPWASGMNVYVGFSPNNGKLSEIIWRVGSPATWGRVSVRTLNWNAPTGPGFGTYAPFPVLQMPADLRSYK